MLTINHDEIQTVRRGGQAGHTQRRRQLMDRIARTNRNARCPFRSESQASGIV